MHEKHIDQLSLPEVAFIKIKQIYLNVIEDSDSSGQYQNKEKTLKHQRRLGLVAKSHLSAREHSNCQVANYQVRTYDMKQPESRETSDDKHENKQVGKRP